MILIAHRGNISGPNKELENNPDYIKNALKAGFHAEIDVWYKDNKYFLGHDKPDYEIDKKFLFNNKLWCHSKDVITFANLIELGANVHTFFHDTDDVVLTSQKWLWTFPGKTLAGKRSIAVMPERVKFDYPLNNIGGICSDYIENYKKNLNYKFI